MDFEQYVIDKLDKIDKRQDEIFEATIRQDENIKQNCKDIEDVKKNVIPQAVKNGNMKTKYMLAVNGFLWVVGILTYIIKTFVLN